MFCQLKLDVTKVLEKVSFAAQLLQAEVGQVPEVDAQSAAGVSALSAVQAHTPCLGAGFVIWMSKLSCVLINLFSIPFELGAWWGYVQLQTQGIILKFCFDLLYKRTGKREKRSISKKLAGTTSMINSCSLSMLYSPKGMSGQLKVCSIWAGRSLQRGGIWL